MADELSNVMMIWLVMGQTLSAKEFLDLLLKKYLGQWTPYVSFFVIVLGLFLDRLSLGITIPLGVYGVIFVGIYLLHSKLYERVFLSVLFFLVVISMAFFSTHNPKDIDLMVVLFLILQFITIVIDYFSKRRPIHFFLYGIAVLINVVYEFHSQEQHWDSVKTSLVAALMMGLYVRFWLKHQYGLEQTKRNAHRDALTGAMTRHGFAEWMKREPKESIGAVLFCDIDNFKQINDHYGHDIGDEVLKEVARRLENGMRDTDALVRFGGDEFQIWSHIPEENSVAFVRGLHDLVTEYPIVISSKLSIRVQLSIGWHYGVFDHMASSLADQALLFAKGSGKNRFVRSNEEFVQNYDDKVEMNAEVTMEDELVWLVTATEWLWSTDQQAKILLDHKEQIYMVNTAYEKITGFSKDQAIGNTRRFNDVYPIKTLFKHFENEQTIYKTCLLKMKPNGTLWWENAQWMSILKDGKIVGYQGVIAHALKRDFIEFITSPFWRGGISWVFQPIIDTHEGGIVGFEALARPHMGKIDVSPIEFFHLAEQNGQRIQADFECMESLLEYLSRKARFWRGKRLFINWYAGSLHHIDRITSWYRRLQEQVPGLHCVFEVLERYVDEIDTEVFQKLRIQLPEVEFAQDDFGAGENDLLRLKHLQTEWIKLDKQLIDLATEDKDMMELVLYFQHFAKKKHVKVICEGLETLQQAQLFRDYGMQYEQGYLWSKPLEHPELYVPSDMCIYD
ncbi:bifunctional diguanylate cyclase/phosphodiesterase [Sulfoacidibacillus ferrooxidans]|nr:bifunctional diguanylate cyclase/phosphodiesterase [Sulfoacidibacillus ferrooxidans]